MLIILNIGCNQQKNNMMARAHIFVRGLVQGVYFRHYTETTARRIGVTGWAKNLRDGRVEVLCEGRKENVLAMVEWCKQGPPHGRVDDVEVNWEEYRGDSETFDVRY
jgi:acylphosphatase